MVYIVYLLACLANDPTQCSERVIDLPEVSNVSSCQLVGQLRLREWARNHPEMRISKAKCMGKPAGDEPSRTAQADR